MKIVGALMIAIGLIGSFRIMVLKRGETIGFMGWILLLLLFVSIAAGSYFYFAP